MIMRIQLVTLVDYQQAEHVKTNKIQTFVNKKVPYLGHIGIANAGAIDGSTN